MSKNVIHSTSTTTPNTANGNTHDNVEVDVPIVNRIVERLRSVVGDAEKIALHEPNLGDLEREYVDDCVSSGWVSSVGSYVDRFEEQLARYTGASFAVATVNGTSALHIALLLAGVGENDEVICPSLSFVATANAIHYCHAVPHFVDIDARTLGLDAEKLSSHLAEIGRVEGGQLINRITGRRIAAIVPMHALGHSVDLQALQQTAELFGLPIVEDAAESLGSFYDGKHTGTFGLVGALSFNGNKIITTGGGGAILTNDADLARRAKHLTTTAKQTHRWRYFHDEAGFNYRMPNLNAALGCAQLERFEDIRERKQRLASRYRQCFQDCPDASFVDPWPAGQSNYWLNAIELTRSNRPIRDSLLDACNASGMMARPLWELLSDLPMYRHCPSGDLDCGRDAVAKTLCLPSSAGLG